MKTVLASLVCYLEKKAYGVQCPGVFNMMRNRVLQLLSKASQGMSLRLKLKAGQTLVRALRPSSPTWLV